VSSPETNKKTGRQANVDVCVCFSCCWFYHWFSTCSGFMSTSLVLQMTDSVLKCVSCERQPNQILKHVFFEHLFNFLYQLPRENIAPPSEARTPDADPQYRIPPYLGLCTTGTYLLCPASANQNNNKNAILCHFVLPLINIFLLVNCTGKGNTKTLICLYSLFNLQFAYQETGYHRNCVQRNCN